MPINLIVTFCSALVIALLFSSYTVTGTGSRWSFLLVLDTLSLSALLYLFLHSTSIINSLKLRIAITFFISIVISLAFIGNVFYHQVFHDWIHPDLFGQWRAGLSIQNGLFNNLAFREVFFALFLPLAVSIFAVTRTYKSTKYSKRAVFLTLILSLSIHSVGSSSHFDPSENNFLVNLAKRLS